MSHVEAALDHVGDHIIDDGLHGVLSFSSTAREGLGGRATQAGIFLEARAAAGVSYEEWGGCLLECVSTPAHRLQEG